AVLAAAPTFTPKRRETLETHADDARQSRELAKIRIDVPVVFEPEALRYRGPSREKCFALFSSLGFRTLVADYAPTAESSDREYAVVTSLDEADALVNEIRTPRRVGSAAISSSAS